MGQQKSKLSYEEEKALKDIEASLSIIAGYFSVDWEKEPRSLLDRLQIAAYVADLCAHATGL